MPNPTVAIRLDEETQDRLKTLGRLRDRSPHYLMREAVERYLTIEEAVEAERTLMRERWRRYELTGEALAHNDVKAWAERLSGAPKR